MADGRQLPPAREVAQKVIIAYAAEAGRDWRWENLRYAIEDALRYYGINASDVENESLGGMSHFHSEVEKEMEGATVQVTVTWPSTRCRCPCSCPRD
jgi:hypothetical protein